MLFESKSWLPKGVFVDKEYTQEIENQQCLLRPILKLARSFENYKGKCKLVDDHLVIHGMKYYVSDIYKLQNESERLSCVQQNRWEGEVLGFFRELNPLSNFHPAAFELNGKSYNSSEQFIQKK